MLSHHHSVPGEGLAPLVPLSAARELLPTSLAVVLGLPALGADTGVRSQPSTQHAPVAAVAQRGASKSCSPTPGLPEPPVAGASGRQNVAKHVKGKVHEGSRHGAGQFSREQEHSHDVRVSANDVGSAPANPPHVGETSSLAAGGQQIHQPEGTHTTGGNNRPPTGLPPMPAAAMSEQHGSFNSPPTSFMTTGAHPLSSHAAMHHPLAAYHSHMHAHAFSSGGSMHPPFHAYPGAYPPYMPHGGGFPLMGPPFMTGGPIDFHSNSYSRGGHSAGASGLKAGSNGNNGSYDGTGEYGGDDCDGTRAVKRPRLVWTPQLHRRFEEAIGKLGDQKAVPKNIMQEMNVEGLTRENVASHLQKYRLQRQAVVVNTAGTSADAPSSTGGAATSAPATA